MNEVYWELCDDNFFLGNCMEMDSLLDMTFDITLSSGMTSNKWKWELILYGSYENMIQNCHHCMSVGKYLCSIAHIHLGRSTVRCLYYLFGLRKWTADLILLLYFDGNRTPPFQF